MVFNYIDSIIEIFKFLMNNIFDKFKGKIYQQVIGIPMGCDCASKIADLFRACLITLHSNFEIFQKGHPAVEFMIDRRIFER